MHFDDTFKVKVGEIEHKEETDESGQFEDEKSKASDRKSRK